MFFETISSTLRQTTKCRASVDGKEIRKRNEGTALIYTSTGSCYGTVEGTCNQETPISLLSLYGSSRAGSQKLTLAAGGTALRLATMFGMWPGMRLDPLVTYLTYKALTLKHLDHHEAHFKCMFLRVRDAMLTM